MAVIEIAKIQVRRGDARTTGLPQLDTGEFGWAVKGAHPDKTTPELYIGNKTADGAPATANIRVLTELDSSNLFDYASNYVYRGNSGSTIITGSQGNGDTERSIQSKIDDYVSIADFGVVNDEVNTLTPDGAPVYRQIQQAIDQVFLNSDRSKPASRKKLLFPAGTYLITGTIYVPPHASIIGEGPDKTVLQMTTNTSIMQLVDESSTPASHVTFTPTLTSMTNWVNLVRFEGMTFNYSTLAGRSNVAPLLRLDCAEDVQITNCKFVGHHDTSLVSVDSYAGIELRGQSEIDSRNVLIENSVFDSLQVGIKSGYNISDISIKGNTFFNLNRGIVWKADEYAATVGPFRSKIDHNNFRNIEYEAVFVGANDGSDTDHVSSFNSFSEVGNNIAGDENPSTAILNFATGGNVSIEDKFSRDDYIKAFGVSDTVYTQPIQGSTLVSSNKTSTSDIENTTFASPVIFAKVPYSGNDQTIKVQYIVRKPSVGISRKGDLTVSISLDNSATVTDSYSYVGSNDGSITFAADLNIDTTTVNLMYTSTNSLGTLEVNYSYLQ